MSAPDGFAPMAYGADGLIGLLGPFCWRKDGEDFLYGFQSDARHGNPNGVIHGGALTAFADTLTGHLIEVTTGRKCATIALDTRYLAPGPVGAWVTARARLRRMTRALAFLDVEMEAAGEIIATADCIYRVFTRDAAQGRDNASSVQMESLER